MGVQEGASKKIELKAHVPATPSPAVEPGVRVLRERLGADVLARGHRRQLLLCSTRPAGLILPACVAKRLQKRTLLPHLRIKRSSPGHYRTEELSACHVQISVLGRRPLQRHSLRHTSWRVAGEQRRDRRR